MKKIDLSIVDEAFLESYLKSIDVNKIKSALSDIKYKIIVDNLEDIITTNDLQKYSNLCDNYSSNEKIEIKKAFDYAGHRQNPLDFLK
jgi:hypothetical protein